MTAATRATSSSTVPFFYALPFTLGGPLPTPAERTTQAPANIRASQVPLNERFVQVQNYDGQRKGVYLLSLKKICR